MFKNKLKQLKPHKLSKYNEKQFIFYGVNYLIGYGFIVGMCSAFGHLGLFYLLSLIFCGIIIFCVGLNYAKITQIFPNSYGVGYLISRKAFGKFGGFLNGWLQYIQSPIIAVASISGIVWSFQNINLFGIYIDKTWLNEYGWILAIISAIIFWCLTIILTYGFTATKIALYIFSFLKWSFFVIVILGALSIIISNLIHDPQIVIKNITDYAIPKNVNFTNIIFGTFTIFFSLGGIEGLATMNADVQNPETTVPKTIFWTIISTIIFYFLFFIITLTALGAYGDTGILPGNFDPTSTGKTGSPNPSAFIVSILFPGVFGIVINFYVILTQIANKCTNRLQASWMFSRNLISLSANGLLPKYLIKVNLKNNQFSRCIWLDFVIGFILIVIYILIFALDPTHSVSSKLDNSFDAISLQISLLYFYTGISTLYCWYRGRIQLSKFNITTTLFSVFATTFLCVCFVVLKIMNYIQFGDISDLLSLSFIIILLATGFIIYIVGNWKKWDKDAFPDSWNVFLNNNPQIQIKAN